MTIKVQWKVKDFAFPSNHHHVAIKGQCKKQRWEESPKLATKQQ
jgi:hypothetical protein